MHVFLEAVIKKKALESYGRNLGLAFQIADDALDYYAKKNFLVKKLVKIFMRKSYSSFNNNIPKGNEEEKEFLTR